MSSKWLNQPYNKSEREQVPTCFSSHCYHVSEHPELFYAKLIWRHDSCKFHSAVNDQHWCCDIVMHSCVRSFWSQYIWAIKILPIERNDRKGNRAHVHLYFMILRLELIAVKNWFWTWTAASKSPRQHILKLWKLFLSQWWWAVCLHLQFNTPVVKSGSILWNIVVHGIFGICLNLVFPLNIFKQLHLIMSCPAYWAELSSLHVILREPDKFPFWHISNKY